jgi:anti-sigma factor RsiW
MRFWRNRFWPTKFWPGWRKHVGDDLSAFVDGILPAEQSVRISEHLQHCQSCRKEHDDVRFGAALATHLGGADAPEGLWNALERRWEDHAAATAKTPHGRRAIRRPAFAAGAAAVAVLAGLVVYLGPNRRLLRPSPPAGAAAPVSEAPAGSGSAPAATAREQFDLDAYLRPVTAAPRDQSFRVISTALPRFTSVDRQEALRTAGLSVSATAMTPLPGYRLVTYRASRVDGERVVQLIYGNGKQGFSVFVAPRGVEFSFGRGSCVETHVGGIHCGKLDCPYQETYSFSEGPYRCVLVSKSLDAKQAVMVMNYFMSAQKSSRGGR